MFSFSMLIIMYRTNIQRYALFGCQLSNTLRCRNYSKSRLFSRSIQVFLANYSVRTTYTHNSLVKTPELADKIGRIRVCNGAIDGKLKSIFPADSIVATYHLIAIWVGIFQTHLIYDNTKLIPLQSKRGPHCAESKMEREWHIERQGGRENCRQDASPPTHPTKLHFRPINCWCFALKKHGFKEGWHESGWCWIEIEIGNRSLGGYSSLHLDLLVALPMEQI
jgi:hypothetical protein